METTTIDIKVFLTSMAADLEKLGLSKTPAVMSAFAQTNANASNRLTNLVKGISTGDIDDEFAKKQFADEVNVWATELISYGIIGAQIAEETRDLILNKVATVALAVLMQLMVKG